MTRGLRCLLFAALIVACAQAETADEEPTQEMKLQYFVETENFDAVKDIFSSGLGDVDINTANGQNMTPLGAAAYLGNSNILKFLLEKSRIRVDKKLMVSCQINFLVPFNPRCTERYDSFGVGGNEWAHGMLPVAFGSWGKCEHCSKGREHHGSE
jgi:hypothetical protein